MTEKAILGRLKSATHLSVNMAGPIKASSGSITSPRPAVFHMKSLLYLCMALTWTIVSVSAGPWLTDYGTANLRRAAENKCTLILFTGSDWCPACRNLQNNVLSKPEFLSYASTNLILVEIDFPKKQAIPPNVRQARESLAKFHRVTRYPTIVLLDTKEQEVIRLNGFPTTPGEFINLIDQYVNRRRLPRDSEPAPPQPAFNGAPTSPVRLYSDLTLKAITGAQGRRFALLNNQTFAAGDIAKVKLADREVKVRCVEVREKSMIVTVDGEQGQREIRLAGAQ